MATMEEGKIDVRVKLKREQRNKDELPKLHTDQYMFVFEIEVTVLSNCVIAFFFLKRENLGRSDEAKRRKTLIMIKMNTDNMLSLGQ